MKRHERSLARRSALQVLYQSEILDKPADVVLDEGLVPEDAAMSDFARMLVFGVSAHKSELDSIISGSSQNWSIDRMPVVDRSLLRLAVYEMKYVDDVPVSVSINEAVELAKEFGGEDDSHRFVNGILGRIAREGDTPADAAAPEAVQPEQPLDEPEAACAEESAPAAEPQPEPAAEPAE